jgi:uncharacterized protein YndB with AHSA1/START domain
MQKEIKHTWHFNQSPEEVWEYLTKPELIEQWLMKNNFQPVAGHKFRFTFVSKPNGKYKGTVDCEVLEVKPFSRLSYSWNGATEDGGRTFTSIVVWTLVPKNGGTELQLLHNGFEVLEDVLAHSNGWKSCLKKLEESINA